MLTPPLRHVWPEVVMENHTRSSAVHGKSHTWNQWPIRKTYCCLNLYMWKKCPALFSRIFWLHRNTFECFATFRVQFSTFFSVKSSCALLTWQEMVISPRARNFLPGVKSPFPPGWRERMMISLKKMKRYRNLSMTVAYIDLVWGMGIFSSRGL